VAVAEEWLSSIAPWDEGRPSAGLPVELVVHVEHAALAARRVEPGDRHAPDATPHGTLADGTALALATARRLACDASFVLVDDSRAADGAESLPSRRTRRITPRLRRALRLRDDGCRFPGCTNRLTDAHHVVTWIGGGATNLLRPDGQPTLLTVAGTSAGHDSGAGSDARADHRCLAGEHPPTA